MLKHVEDQMLTAQEMGNDFANFRGEQLTEEFMRLSGLLEAEKARVPDRAEEEVLKFVMGDYGEAFKRYLALAYSMGMMDGFQNTPKKTYRNAKDQEESKQPTLPGFVI